MFGGVAWGVERKIVSLPYDSLFYFLATPDG